MIEVVKDCDNTSTALVWFRRDFRINNNPALSYALENFETVIPTYIHQQEGEWAAGGSSRWWTHESLSQLELSLEKLGLNIHYFNGDAATIIPQIGRELNVSALCWNDVYEPDELALSLNVINALENIEIKNFNSHLFFDPGTLLNKQELPYRVFTPFWKTARARLENFGIAIANPIRVQVNDKQKIIFKNECSLNELNLLDENKWFLKLYQYWTPGEDSAKNALNIFINDLLADYNNSRDIPSVNGTSQLSAHLHFGEITPAQIFYRLQQHTFKQPVQAHLERFLTQLGWREFAHHILWHYPHTTNQCMNSKFSKLWPKKVDEKLFNAWKTGSTGVDIIDAGMKQLWETGLMHNRVRMITGSFLTKNLGIHWIHGAKWFWDTLIDADLANNTMGWQWVAGSGVDAAPYYRIFNPLTQTKRFDSELKYIRQWLPEDKLLVREPIVDIKISRENALARYENL